MSLPDRYLEDRNFAEESQDENYGFGPIATKREETVVFHSYAAVAAVVFLLVAFAKGWIDGWKGWIEVGAGLFLQAAFIIIASVIRQACYFVDEARHAKCRHRGSYRSAWQACSGVPFTTRWPVLVTLMLSLLVSFLHIHVVLGILSHHWHWMLLFAFLCLLMTWRKVPFDIVMSSDPDLMPGVELAYSAFHAYYGTMVHTLLDRIKKYEEDNKVEMAVKKLFILMPSSCRIDSVLGAGHDDDSIEPANSMRELCLNRAGVKGREFKNTVYLINNGGDDPFYCLAEGATPLLTLRNMKEHSKLTEAQMREQVCYFYQALEELLKNDEKCANLFRLVLYEDSDGSRIRKVSNILREEILRERQRVASKSCV